MNEYEDIINFYGKQAQAGMAMEECAELIQAVNKCLRYPDNAYKIADLLEEMADVTIMIEQLKEIFDIENKDLDAMIEKKRSRIFDRLQKQKEMLEK